MHQPRKILQPRALLFSRYKITHVLNGRIRLKPESIHHHNEDDKDTDAAIASPDSSYGKSNIELSLDAKLTEQTETEFKDNFLALNVQDINGDTGLHIVCRQGLPLIALEMIRQGANINLANTRGETPLMSAMAANQIETVVMLTEQTAEVLEDREKEKQRALEKAAIKKRREENFKELRFKIYLYVKVKT